MPLREPQRAQSSASGWFAPPRAASGNPRAARRAAKHESWPTPPPQRNAMSEYGTGVSPALPRARPLLLAPCNSLLSVSRRCSQMNADAWSAPSDRVGPANPGCPSRQEDSQSGLFIASAPRERIRAATLSRDSRTANPVGPARARATRSGESAFPSARAERARTSRFPWTSRQPARAPDLRRCPQAGR